MIMMVTFKDYLDKNSWVLNSHSDTKVVTTETLGKWHLEKWIKHNKDLQYSAEELIENMKMILKGRDLPLANVILSMEGVPYQSHLEIAVDCLGEKEVKKRLEELNK
ncbi:hypothetical protein LCGC14_2756480 [marine sediment metagenome]|uniref:Uncharacterized protein n=1 Tax=marine sediment metagenome TaxID=412755 RepID=A0A0F9BRX0_9ZZZZ